MTIPTEYTVVRSGQRNSSLKLAPGLKLGSKKKSIEARLGEIDLVKGQERSGEVKFSSSERFLDSIFFKDAIKWILNLPNTQHVFRDFLFGNLYLFVVCPSSSRTWAGKISARPSDMQFFDSKRELLLGRTKTLLMWFALERQGIKIRNENGVSIEFAAEDKNDE